MPSSPPHDSPVPDHTDPTNRASASASGGSPAKDAPDPTLSGGAAFQRQDNLGTILRSIGDAVLVTDASGRVTFLNPVAEQLTLWEAGKAIGQDSCAVFDIISEQTRQIVESPIQRVLREGVIAGLANHTILRRHDGSEIYIDDSAAPVRDEAGQLVGVVLVFRDITERRAAEIALRLSDQRMRLATASANIGTWDMDPGTGELFWDARCRAAFGYPLDQPLDYSTFLTLVHPEDRRAADDAAQAALSPTGSGVFRTEYRTVGYEDGIVRWVHAEGRAIFDDSRTSVTRFIGTVQDITSRKEAADALARSETRFRLQADAMPQMVWATDPLGNHLYYNRRWYDYTGQTVEESLGFGFSLALHPDDRAKTVELWERAWKNGGDYEIEYRFRRFDGVYRWFVGRAEPIHDPETGTVTLWAGTCTDIDDLKQTQERQRFLSDLTERTRRLLEPNAVIAETVRTVGEFLGLARLLYAEISESADSIRVYPDWYGPDTSTGTDTEKLPSAEGRWTFDAWASAIAPWGATPESLRKGETVVIRDFATDERTAAAYASLPTIAKARSVVRIPRLREGVWVAMVCAESAVPRDWTIEEIGLLEAVAERLWLTLENIRLFSETQMRMERESLVNTIGAAIRSSPLDAPAILKAAVEALGQGLQADRCYYVAYDQADDAARVQVEWRRPSRDLEPMVGRLFPMSAYSVDRDPEYRAGLTHVVNDVVAFLPDQSAPLLALGIRALLRVPLQIGDQMTALAVAFAADAHHWTRGEIRVVETVASQLQSALDAARLLTEERARAEWEHLLNEIGEAVRSSSEPEEMQRILVERLGAALRAEHCFLSFVDPACNTLFIARDFRSESSLPSLSGHHRLSDFSDNWEALFPKRRALVVPDMVLRPDSDAETAETAPSLHRTLSAFEQMGLRALIKVPLYEGGKLVGALGVGMATGERAWSREEVALIESVASQARASIESARLQQRERNIATQLQDSLQPPTPPPVPGITLAHFYRPALAEASVGGDFFDVFRVREVCTALVVADLSGKGLAAAQQVATVRNMLRFAVYNEAHLAEAVTQMHNILVAHELLTGFATLFVGCFDPAERTLTYVNCGQEPGLIWRRASQKIEELSPTGPVLGGFAGGQFTQSIVKLRAGDVLALFTDGMTEIGPNRASFLEVEGVRALLTECCTGDKGTVGDAEAIKNCLITEVDAYAGGGVQDDIALLVAVVGE